MPLSARFSKLPLVNMTEQTRRKKKLLKPAFIFSPFFTAWKLSSDTLKKSVCVCVRERHCYIFHATDDDRSFHSVYIRAFDKAALVYDGQQAHVGLVWLNAVRHIWKKLWWLDRCEYMTCWCVCVVLFKCVITLFEAIIPTDGYVCWMMSQCECLLSSLDSWRNSQWEFSTCICPRWRQIESWKRLAAGYEIC